MKKNKLLGMAHDEASETPSSEKHESKALEDYEIANHIEALHKAEKIKGDEKLMKALHPHIEKHKEAASKLGGGPVKSIAQLKEKVKQKLSEPD